MFDLKRLAGIFKEKYDDYNKGAQLRQIKKQGMIDRLNPFRDKSFDVKNAQSARVNAGQGDEIFEKQNPIDNIVIRDSTAIKDAKYNPNNGDLNIKFRGGKTYYTYPEVSEDEAEGLKHANSKGRYFNQVIKPHSINAK